MVKNSVKIAVSVALAVILLLAWAPWLTEEYGKEKILDYFNQSYGVDKNDIRIDSVEKKSFAIDFGLYLSPSNKSLPETSVHARVNFNGNVKHEILSAPWFTEKNIKEKFFEHFRKKGFNENNTIIKSIAITPFQADIAFSSPQGQTSGHAVVTVYGEVKLAYLAGLT